MASSSNPIATSATSTTNYFEVFISHRGPDVKKKLATDLYHGLKDSGLQPFLDKDELHVGDHIPAHLKSAIESASVHVAIFSPTYAESSWCLYELLMMLDSKKPIIPIFYGVKPDVLRWAIVGKGEYARQLSILEKKKTNEKQRYDTKTMEEWMRALSRAADLKGFAVEAEACNSDDSQLVDNVVKEVWKNLPKTPIKVAKYPIGLDDKVKEFKKKELMPQQSPKTRVVGIVGIGGVGKTTLAKEIFNRERSTYHRTCFLHDVRENATRGSLNLLQSTLVEDLTGSKVKINHTDEGIGELERRVPPCHAHALIVLDDVDHSDQLNALLFPVMNALSAGSLILVTSRSKDVLTTVKNVETSIYNLEGLNSQHSRELFCSHAFGKSKPVEEFFCLHASGERNLVEKVERLVKKFLDACHGLPLSLEVIGASLSVNYDFRHWEATLSEISKTLPEDIKGRLKISYSGLKEEEKHMFLDSACFFIGEDSDTAIRIWDGLGLNGWLGHRKLQNRCLIEVDSENRIRMHDHLRSPGRRYGRERTSAPALASN